MNQLHYFIAQVLFLLGLTYKRLILCLRKGLEGKVDSWKNQQTVNLWSLTVGVQVPLFPLIFGVMVELADTLALGANT